MALLPFDYLHDEPDYLSFDPDTGLPRTLLAQAQPRPGRALPKSLGMVTNTAPTAPQPTAQQAPAQQAPAQPQSALEQLPEIYKQSNLLRDQAYDKLTPSDADLEQYRRSGTLGQLAGIAMQVLGNEGQAAVGGSVLKQSMAELEKGKRDPWKVAEMEAKKLEAQATALENQAKFAVTVEEKREAQRQANEARREANQIRLDTARMHDETRRFMVANRPAAQEPLVQVYDPQTQATMYVPRSQAAGMQPPPRGGGGDKSSESERGAAGYLHRMVEAEKTLSNPALAAGEKPGLIEQGVRALGLQTGANVVSGAPRQQVRQAQEDWVRAKLRKESGAVIGEEEMAAEIRVYFPQIGDGPQLIRQKANARRAAEEQMRFSAGRVEPRNEPGVTNSPGPAPAPNRSTDKPGAPPPGASVEERANFYMR